MKDRGGLTELLQLRGDLLTKMVTVLALQLLAQSAVVYQARSKATRPGAEKPAIKLFLGSDGIVRQSDQSPCADLSAALANLPSGAGVALYLPSGGAVPGGALLGAMAQIQGAGGQVLLAGHAGGTRP
ncbi:MAG: hypothetical protein AB7O66_13640 [Limisphaerales bacterium]